MSCTVDIDKSAAVLCKTLSFDRIPHANLRVQSEDRDPHSLIVTQPQQTNVSIMNLANRPPLLTLIQHLRTKWLQIAMSMDKLITPRNTLTRGAPFCVSTINWAMRPLSWRARMARVMGFPAGSRVCMLSAFKVMPGHCRDELRVSGKET